MKSTKGFVRDVFDAFVTHYGLVCDLTGTDCFTENGGIQGRVFTLSDFQMLISSM